VQRAFKPFESAAAKHTSTRNKHLRLRRRPPVSTFAIAFDTESHRDPAAIRRTRRQRDRHAAEPIQHTADTRCNQSDGIGMEHTGHQAGHRSQANSANIHFSYRHFACRYYSHSLLSYRKPRSTTEYSPAEQGKGILPAHHWLQIGRAHV